MERVRTNKTINLVSRFDPRDNPLECVFVHYFKHESLPDGRGTMDETIQWHGRAPAVYRPLQSNLVVSPPDSPSIERFPNSGRRIEINGPSGHVMSSAFGAKHGNEIQLGVEILAAAGREISEPRDPV